MNIEERKKYLGGTDCAAVLGLSKWRTPLQVWAEKTGQLAREDISAKMCVRVGIKSEEMVAELFEEETGKKVRRVNDTIFHPTHPFLGANIDRRVVGENAILECKTTTSWNGHEWDGEEIPQEYILQVLHYMAVTGAKKAYIAVLIGNNEFIWKEINRDENLIAEIVKKEVSFWNDFVLTKQIPKMISCKDSETLCKLFDKIETEQPIVLDDSANMIIESIEGLKADKKSIEGKIEQLENELKVMLQNNEIGESALYKITWKEQITKRLDTKEIKDKEPGVYDKYTKESKTRIFRIKKLEGVITNGNNNITQGTDEKCTDANARRSA